MAIESPYTERDLDPGARPGMRYLRDSDGSIIYDSAGAPMFEPL